MSDPLGLISNSGGLRNDLSIRTPAKQNPDGPSFRKALEQELAAVNQLQQDAKEAVEDYASGRRDDLDSVIGATKKAETAFNMLLQVRNKVMDALDEVKQIRV